MKHVKGYSLVEVAIVLVILSLLISGFIAGFGHYRDRAEFIGGKRNSELEDLIAMDKAVPANEAHAVDPVVLPEPEPEPDPEAAPEPENDGEVVNGKPFWKRWLDWWRDTGKHDNRRGNRS